MTERREGKCRRGVQAWKPGLALALAGAVLAAWVSQAPVRAQTSRAARAKNFVAPVTDAQGRKSVLRGEEARPVGNGLIRITRMKAETYRGADRDMIFEAPECLFDTRANVAFSPDALSIRTADNRFSIEGKGFHWSMGDSGLTSKLIISNQVHSLVRKRLIAKAGSQAESAPRVAGGTTNAPAPVSAEAAVASGDFIDITSEAFEYQADRAVFRSKVRVREEEGNLSCGVMKVLFRGEGGALERIEAENEVELDQGTTRAMADSALYTVGQDKESVELIGHALWSDGQRQGSGKRVTFDRRNRILHAEEQAYLRLPRSVLGQAMLLSTRSGAGAGATNANEFIEVFSETMTIRLPETNGPVQSILAEKSVLIVDPEQDGRALADRAEYEERTGVLELTGSPILETEHRLINGKALRFDRATRMFTAGPDAYVKLPVSALSGSGVVAAHAGPRRPAGGTNLFLEVWAKEFQYGTNLLRFREKVRANLLEGDLARGKLTCEVLTIHFGEQVQSVEAERDVEVEQFALKSDPAQMSRKLSCPILKARFTPQGRLDVAEAFQGVRAEQEETRAGRPRPTLTRLSADSLTAVFSRTTNRVDRIVAEKDVVFAQDERIARGAKAVYTDADGLTELTGDPTATMPEGRIFEAERLIWDRLHERFLSRGRFKSEWKRRVGDTNNPVLRAAGAKEPRK